MYTGQDLITLRSRGKSAIFMDMYGSTSQEVPMKLQFASETKKMSYLHHPIKITGFISFG